MLFRSVSIEYDDFINEKVIIEKDIIEDSNENNINIENSYYKYDEIYKILSENKKINQFENLIVNKDTIIIEGLVIRKVRIDRIYTNKDMKISEIIITKKDLEESILKKNKDVKKINIEIYEGFLKATGEANLMGLANSMELEGTFYIDDNREIFYSLSKAKVKKIIPVPKGILDKFDKKINPFFKLNDLGIDLYLSYLIFEEERIIVR